MARLSEKLSELKEKGKYPMHMPGHKRHAPRHKGALSLPYAIDVTEIEGFDDLHAPEGVLRELEERAANLYGASRAFALVGGSTCGILSAVKALLPFGEKAIITRNSHASVYHALSLRGAEIKYVYPDIRDGIFASVTPREVEEAFDRDPDAKLFVMTSPTYEGVVSDIKAIAETVHSRGAKLLVDAAHGAHLIYQTESFPENAIKYADISVTSLHKTMPALTQTALALVYNGELESDMAAAIDIFETSSPSYILLSSIDECIYVAEQGAALFEEWSRRLDRFYSSLSSLENLKILPTYEGAYALDRSKICLGFERLSLDGRDFTARDFGRALRDGGFEPEMIAYNYAVLMTGCFDDDVALDNLAKLLLSIDKRLTGVEISKTAPTYPHPAAEMRISETEGRPFETLDIDSAIGKISMSYIKAYPPGIPLVVPGEMIDADVIKRVKELSTHGVNVIGGERVKVLKK